MRHHHQAVQAGEVATLRWGVLPRRIRAEDGGGEVMRGSSSSGSSGSSGPGGASPSSNPFEPLPSSQQPQSVAAFMQVT